MKLKMNHSLGRKIIFSSITLLLSLIVLIVSGELICRYFLDEYLDDFKIDERNLNYRYDENFGWFPIPNLQGTFTGNQTIHFKNNSLGFRDIEHGEKKKPRLLFLGDSFVWGYDVEQDQLFTDKIQEMIPDWEIINLGVSGYGTDQEYLLLQKYFDYYKPDIVFLIFNRSDYIDNELNINYGAYFKPFYEVENNDLKLKGVPVPKSANYYYSEYQSLFSKSYFLKAILKAYKVFFTPKALKLSNPTFYIVSDMKNFTEKKGSIFIMGSYIHENVMPQLEELDNILLSYINNNNMNHIRLKTDFVYYSHGFHWTPRGHIMITDEIYNYLKENNFLELQPKTINKLNTSE
ncbi:MAG: hypothetical protein A2X59_02730 [Nitrospirae bacterium GWC2_42_7]|nr:MAG: hypothetical protein A2X59_02730 [Nitrospirae bacterium GWC2_42_7]